MDRDTLYARIDEALLLIGREPEADIRIAVFLHLCRLLRRWENERAIIAALARVHGPDDRPNPPARLRSARGGAIRFRGRKTGGQRP